MQRLKKCSDLFLKGKKQYHNAKILFRSNSYAFKMYIIIKVYC